MSIEEEIKQRQFRSPHQKAVINLIFTANRLQAQQQNFFRPYGITNQQFNILRILRGQRPKKISGAEIRSRMLDRNSDISRLLERLHAKGLIERTPCPSDKRADDVAITAAGLAILTEMDAGMERLEQELLRLSAAEAQQLSVLLDKSRG
jgi:DNA-binding MarR family transcriptional regulator